MGKEKEDYLRTIYELEEHENGVRSVEISKKLKITKASVSEMLRKLAKEDLIKIKPYSKIFLTRKGRKVAEQLFDKYYTIKSFIKKFLKYEQEQAKEEACKLEHAFSDEGVKIIEKLMGENQGEELRGLPGYVG